MIKLQNIKNNGKTIQCDFLVEDCEELCHLSIDLQSKEMQYALPRGYEWCRHHLHKAYRYLLDHADCLPERHNIVWY